MKKLFFFRASASSNGSNSSLQPSSTDKQNHRENEGESGKDILSSQKFKHRRRAQNRVNENESLGKKSRLRRSHSFSSAAFRENGLVQGNWANVTDQSDSLSSSDSSVRALEHNHSSHCRALTPDRHTRRKQVERPLSSPSAKASHDCSKSISSGDDSNQVLDLYIDGEQQQEQNRRMSKTSRQSHTGCAGGKWPPRVQYTAPASPNGSTEEKPKCHSFRGTEGMQLHLPPKDWVETGFGHESSEKLAKLVVDRLSQSQLKDDHKSDSPITLEDIYAGSMSKCCNVESNGMDRKGFTSDDHCESDIVGFSKDFSSFGANNHSLYPEESGDDVDMELKSKLREAEDRVLALSNELEQDRFLEDIDFNVPALIHRIRELTEEKLSLSEEVSGTLQSHIADRYSTMEELRTMRLQLDFRTRKLEKEKNEVESALEKELDRRSSEWSFRMEKYQAEEQRLRLRVRELAEQNVNLQRELSSFSEKETEKKNMIAQYEKQIMDLTADLEETKKENQTVHQHLFELQEKFKITREEKDCFRKNFLEKERECKDLHRSITRLLRTCTEQEKTIDGLQSTLGEALTKHLPLDGSEKLVQKLQVEQLRLVGVEQCLRKDIESLKVEAASLRNENINLLSRLKVYGKQGGSLTFKLDQELSARLRCLQMQGLVLLGESTNLCSKLIDYVKRRPGHNNRAKDGIDGQFVVECELRAQGFRQGIESLQRSLQNVSSVLHEKSSLATSESQGPNHEDDGLGPCNEEDQNSARSELRAQMLLTSLLQEKLYSKNQEIEQLEAELATAVRGNDIIRCELQNALDDLSCTNHKIKDLELQTMKRDEKMNQLEADYEECAKELTVARGIMPKIVEERDMIWKEVKQYNEKNMLLKSEVDALKKRIESLDEDILLKEGQITILKDSLGKPFDLLSSSDHTDEFQLLQ